MCLHRARLTAGETKVTEQADWSTPAPAHLVPATSHLSSRHHSQSWGNRKCRSYDWQEEEDDQKELKWLHAGKVGVSLEREKKAYRRKMVCKLHPHAHSVFCSVMFVKFLQTLTGEGWRGNECSNTCKQISAHLRWVRNPPWVLSQRVLQLTQTYNSNANTHTAAQIYHWLSQYRGRWQELGKKGGRMEG